MALAVNQRKAAMNQRNGIPLATTPAAKQYEVALNDGTVWTGTKRQLLATNPAWLQYAVEVQPTRTTHSS